MIRIVSFIDMGRGRIPRRGKLSRLKSLERGNYAVRGAVSLSQIRQQCIVYANFVPLAQRVHGQIVRGGEVQVHPWRKSRMLVLSRRSGEEIVVGTDIRVHVLKVGRGRVQLGICAPRDVTVYRHEVVRRIEDQTALYGVPPVQDGTLPDVARRSAIADNDLEQRIRNVLINHGVKCAGQLAVEACSGTVTLSGYLPSVHEKWLCIECCRHVAGARQIVDKLARARTEHAR